MRIYSVVNIEIPIVDDLFLWMSKNTWPILEK